MQLRKELRKRIKERLVNKTKACIKINVNPSEYDHKYPFIEVFTPVDESELISNSIRATGHKLQVIIDVATQADKADIYDALDDLAEEIETQVEKDETFGNLTSALVLTKSETDAIFEGKRTTGFVRLTYEGSYVKQKTPKVDQNLPKFKGIQIGGMDA
ncbi:MAG: hypothetical protein AB8G05_25105 [Oligoflexales bacterium]